MAHGPLRCRPGGGTCSRGVREAPWSGSAPSSLATSAALGFAAWTKGRLLVGPLLGGWVGAYPNGGGQNPEVAAAIAARLASDLLYLGVHDDDILREPETFMSERLAALAKILGIENAVTSYECLKDGDRDGIEGHPQVDAIRRTLNARAIRGAPTPAEFAGAPTSVWVHERYDREKRNRKQDARLVALDLDLLSAKPPR